MDYDYDYLFKYVLVGDSISGKSCFLQRFMEKNLSIRIGVDFNIKTINFEGKRIKLQIWDTVGLERFHEIITSYICNPNLNGLLIIYDITKKETFETLTYWLDQIMAHPNPQLVVMLIGNKSDLESRREVKYEEGEAFAKQHGLLFMEASAKTGHNVEEAFFKFTKAVLLEKGIIREPKWYKEAIEKQGFFEVHITRCIFTGSSRVGKTSLKHILLYDTAREDKTSTAVLEAPKVVILEKRDQVGTEDQIVKSLGEEEEKVDPVGTGQQIVESLGEEGEKVDPVETGEQIVESLGEKVNKGQGDECLLTKGVTVGSAWKAVDDRLLGQLISEMEIKEKDTFPSLATVSQAATVTVQDGLIKRFLKKMNVFRKEPAVDTLEQSLPSGSHTEHDTIKLLDQARDAFLEDLPTEGQSDEKESIRFIYLLDTGGQPSFQNVIPLLVDFPCNFVHVFKASHKLTDPYVNAYCQDGVTEELRTNSRSTWEMMKESITAAYTMSMKSSHGLDAFEVVNEPQLRIFMVGTHLSDLPKSSEARRALLDHNKKVLEEMDNKPYDDKRVFPPKEVVYEGASNYFLLDSQLQGDSEHTRRTISALRSLLSDEKCQLSLKVPKIWFCLQIITSEVKRKMWKFTELKEFCTKWQYIQAIQADRQLLALLNLFHRLGFYVFYDMGHYKEQWVCTDASYLYKEISKVLSVQYLPHDTPLSVELRVFKGTGEIPEAVSEDMFRLLGVDADIPIRWLLEVLVHIGVASKVIEEEKTHYFIPTALPERNVDLPSASVAELGFTFAFKSKFLTMNQRYSCVPTGIFHRLAVDIASSRQATGGSRSDRMSKKWRFCPKNSDSTQFVFSQENAQIVLSQKEDLIQLHLLVPQHFKQLGLPLTKLCRRIREEIYERIIHVCQQVFGCEPLGKKATLEVGVICRNCKDSPSHLKRFEIGNVITGLCTRMNKMNSFTLREAVWVAQKDGRTTNQLKATDNIEFDGVQFLLFEDQSSQVKQQKQPKKYAREGTKEKSPEEINTFLDEFNSSHIKYCNAKVIRFDLERRKVITQGQRQQMESTLNVAAANDLFYQFLCNDPAPETLQGAAEALKNAPDTTNMNKRFAEAIEDFLRSVNSEPQ